jgi:restriction system protein
VKWLHTDLPRTAFEQDLLYSFGAFITVCQVRRNNVERRVEALLSGKSTKPEKTQTAESEGVIDFEQTTIDQIREYVGQKYRGHDLSQLVNSLLKAQGYRTLMSPAGPDGGVDIIAGHGSMGFDSPRICVQVKSSDSPIEVGVLREFQAVMKNFGAEQGLLVSWGGFKSSVEREARQHFFEVRLWDADDLLKALLENYQHLPADVQADLPLKRIWALVPEE